MGDYDLTDGVTFEEVLKCLTSLIKREDTIDDRTRTMHAYGTVHRLELGAVSEGDTPKRVDAGAEQPNVET